MSWYPRRELAAGRVFTCDACGKRKRVKYVPKSNLCRSCAAQQRRTEPTTIVDLTEDISITQRVEKRLNNKANREIPPSKEEIRNNIIVRGLYTLVFIPPWFIVGLVFTPYSGLWWLVLLLWMVIGGLINNYVIDGIILSRPRKERMESVKARVLELAQERKIRIEEQRQFYTSAEWNNIRKLVIEEGGRVCVLCHKYIENEKDITVDHKKPRSKYPELQLSRDNLRILCRSCTSKKGDREWWQ
ncbi:HNH endonuclease [Chloroflexota bacterium]